MRINSSKQHSNLARSVANQLLDARRTGLTLCLLAYLQKTKVKTRRVNTLLQKFHYVAKHPCVVILSNIGSFVKTYRLIHKLMRLTDYQVSDQWLKSLLVGFAVLQCHPYCIRQIYTCRLYVH